MTIASAWRKPWKRRCAAERGGHVVACLSCSALTRHGSAELIRSGKEFRLYTPNRLNDTAFIVR